MALSEPPWIKIIFPACCDYRVIFAIMDNDVLILRIQHRKEVYK